MIYSPSMTRWSLREFNAMILNYAPDRVEHESAQIKNVCDNIENAGWLEEHLLEDLVLLP